MSAVPLLQMLRDAERELDEATITDRAAREVLAAAERLVTRTAIDVERRRTRVASIRMTLDEARRLA